MKLINIIFFTVLFIGIQSCTSQLSHKQTIHEEPMLIGTVDRNELFSEFPVFKNNYDSYVPKDSVIQALKPYAENVHIEIFLGTWCGDSKRNLPPFLKTLDLIGRNNLTYTLHALDRTKKDKAQLTVKYSISRVPTMVFLQGERELGRIIERPLKSVEEDLMTILQR